MFAVSHHVLHEKDAFSEDHTMMIPHFKRHPHNIYIYTYYSDGLWVWQIHWTRLCKVDVSSGGIQCLGRDFTVPSCLIGKKIHNISKYTYIYIYIWYIHIHIYIWYIHIYTYYRYKKKGCLSWYHTSSISYSVSSPRDAQGHLRPGEVDIVPRRFFAAGQLGHGAQGETAIVDPRHGLFGAWEWAQLGWDDQWYYPV